MPDTSKFSRILVTGGAGFIGSEYVRSAISGDLYGGAPDRVQVLDLLTYAGNTKRLFSVSQSSRFEFIQGSINDIDLVDKLISQNDAVLHFAAESHVDRSILDSTKFVETNVLGTNVLLNAATKYSKTIILISTDEVYGSLAQELATEESPLSPSSPYSASKAAGELLALAFHTTHGLDVRITRAANNYGKYQDNEKLIPKSIQYLQAGMPIRLYGNGGNIRNWLHISDHCEAISRVLHLGSAGEVYNVGGEESYTNIEIAKTLIQYFGKSKEDFEFTTDRLGHDWRYAVDSLKIKKELGWVPQRKLFDSIQEIVDGQNFLS
jgi:dTDP-glucose 4,6-dehydratase